LILAKAGGAQSNCSGKDCAKRRKERPASKLLASSSGNPALDWIRLAGAMGVEGARAETLEKLADLLATSNRRKGPFLIELMIP